VCGLPESEALWNRADRARLFTAIMLGRVTIAFYWIYDLFAALAVMGAIYVYFIAANDFGSLILLIIGIASALMGRLVLYVVSDRRNTG
jgi:hypothetical protein